MNVNNPNQFAAADEFMQEIISKLATKNGVHAETAVSAAARMAGTFVLYSAGLPLEQLDPGAAIFAEMVDGHGQRVLGLVDEALEELGVQFEARNVNYGLPRAHDPRLSLMETQALLDESFHVIAGKFGLTEMEAAGAMAIAAAILIQKCARFLDPHVAYALTAYGMVEGSKTVPFREMESPELVFAG